MDNKKSNASRACRLKVATLLIDGGSTSQLNEAIELCESNGCEALTAKLTSFGAKNHFFSALLVALALGDPLLVQNKLGQYKDIDYSFAATRECDFITKLVTALENIDLEAFETACADFDRITPFDPWKIRLLLKAKEPLTAANEAAQGGGDVDLS